MMENFWAGCKADRFGYFKPIELSGTCMKPCDYKIHDRRLGMGMVLASQSVRERFLVQMMDWRYLQICRTDCYTPFNKCRT